MVRKATTGPPDLIAKIHAEIAKDIELVHGEDEQEHTQRHWPDRIERQADAFKRVLARHQPVVVERTYATDILCSTCRETEEYESGWLPWPCPEVLDLAAVYDIKIGATEPPVAQVVTETSCASMVVFEQLGFVGQQ